MAGPSLTKIREALKTIEAAVGMAPAKRELTRRQKAALKRGREILAQRRRGRR